MKKLISFLLLAAAVAPLASCGEDIPELLLADKDFDGIYDSYDSAPENNKSGFTINDSFFGTVSNEILVPVDYRNFVFDGAPAYNKDLAQMCAFIANYSYADQRKNWTISDTNRYSSLESDINPCLVQFGFTDLKHVTTKAGETDPYDIVGLYLGNHILRYEDNNYQVIVASIEGYPSNSMWYSNLEIGYDSEGYYEASGEHPEWTNKKHHKGFDITANRAFKEIKVYSQEVKEETCKEQIVLVTGHSRGGAVTNLVGKCLKDNNMKSICYAFNGPRTTTEDNKEVLESYTNIFNVDSANDYVCRYPFSFMGFTSYGKIVRYDLVAHNDYYKSLFNHDFYGNASTNLDAIDNLAEKVFISREGMYEYLEKDPNVDEYELCESKDAADALKAQMDEEIKKAGISGLAKAQVVENEDPVSAILYPYVVEYYTKPAAFLAFAAKCLVTFQDSQNKVEDLLNLVDAGVRYMSRYVGIILDTSGIEVDILNFACPHIQKTCVAGAYVAE